MKMRRKIIEVAVVSLISISTLLATANAGGTGGGRRGGPPPVPEPLSCILLLAGGATLAAYRRWKSKCRSKELEKSSEDSNNINL